MLPQSFVDYWVAEALNINQMQEVAPAFMSEFPPLGVYGWAAMRGFMQARHAAEEDQRQREKQAQLQRQLEQSMGRR